jgi:hypothetical protein
MWKKLLSIFQQFAPYEEKECIMERKILLQDCICTVHLFTSTIIRPELAAPRQASRAEAKHAMAAGSHGDAGPATLASLTTQVWPPEPP